MVRHDQSMLPVIEDEKLMGVVRTVEVLQHVSAMLQQ